MPKLLVVDDDHAVQDMLALALRQEGYVVATSRDGKQALDELSRSAYDLLLLDVLVPRMNGFTLIDEIRRLPSLRELPVILMSGIYKSKNHRSEMTTRFGVIDYLDKPLAIDALLVLIERAVGPGDPGLAASAKEHQELPLENAPARREPDPPLVDGGAEEEKKQVEESARRDFKTSAFLLQGSVATTPLPALLGRLWRAKESGALLLRNGGVKKIVYVRDGQPIFVKSNLVSECLGQVLVRERLISRQDCTASIETMRKTGRRQGEILVEMRCITQKNLEVALELQLEAKIFECFTWSGGDYRFNPSVELPDGRVAVTSTPKLVALGIARTFDETRLRSYMLAILDVPLRARQDGVELSALELASEDAEAFLAVELPKTTRELLDTMTLAPPDSLRLLYTLIALEQLEPAR
jgi:DNA-binding response OmpR family regulator